MKEKQSYNLYVASCDKDGGIYRYHLYESSKGLNASFLDKMPLDRPMYMTIHNNKMHVILRSPFSDSEESAYLSFDLGTDGQLLNQSEIKSTKGLVACHLAVDDSVYCVNYLSGDVIKLPDLKISHHGKSIHPERQTGPHPHQAIFTPDNKYVCIADLGIDKLVIYDKNLNFVSSVQVQKGLGPRHVVFSPDGRYMFCANELGSSVTSFLYNEGNLSELETVSTLPEEYKGENTAAAIRISADGKYLYVSNRGHDSIACFYVENGKLEVSDIAKCGGKSPRDFDITPEGKYLICTNELGNNITALKINNNRLVKTDFEIKLNSPLCVVFSQYSC